MSNGKSGRPPLIGHTYQVRFPDHMISRIKEYQVFVKNKTGAEITWATAVRSLVEESLTNRGLPKPNEEDEDPDCE